MISRSARIVSKMTTTATKPDILFTFGAIADVQCGDLDDRLSVKPYRYYRRALQCLREAVDFWNKRELQPSFVLQLGDVLDGFNMHNGGKEQVDRVIKDVLEACEQFRGEFHHAWGNHELYNFTRLELFNGSLFSGRRYYKEVHPEAHKIAMSEMMTMNQQPLQKAQEANVQERTLPYALDVSCNRMKEVSESDILFSDGTMPAYYDFSPCEGFRFILLDTYDVSTIGYPEGSQTYADALCIIREHNQNEDVREFAGLVGLEQRFVSFNGGIGKNQLDWLKKVLDKARSLQEKVIVFGHVAVYPEVTLDYCLIWNYAEVLKILQSSGCVVATLSGHTHRYDYKQDGTGIHHILMPGIVECKPGTNGYATFDVSAESMKMYGVGDVPTMTLHFSKVSRCAAMDIPSFAAQL